MFKKILLPVDLSNRHDAALRIAIEHARQSGGEVELFHVIEKISDVPIEEERDFYDKLKVKAEKHMNKLAEKLKQAEVRYRREIRIGHRCATIVQHADEEKFDVIILTAPKIDLNSSDGWGSLSYKLSILAPCPVLLVK
ncbi:MAG: universal stress protein [Gemmatales bacterium]|nr:MAG: universal stress protein [Gemmatales bacterium]